MVTHENYRKKAEKANPEDAQRFMESIGEKEVVKLEDTEAITKEAAAEGKWAEEEMEARPSKKAQSEYATGTFKDFGTYLAEKWHHFFYDDEVPVCEAGPKLKVYSGAKQYFLNFVRKPSLNEKIGVVISDKEVDGEL